MTLFALQSYQYRKKPKIFPHTTFKEYKIELNGNQKKSNQKDFLHNREHKFESKGCLNNFDRKLKNDQKGGFLDTKI